MTNPYQERDLANSSRNTMSRVCTLKLGFAVEDPNLSLSYETSDPEVATVKGRQDHLSGNRRMYDYRDGGGHGSLQRSGAGGSGEDGKPWHTDLYPQCDQSDGEENFCGHFQHCAGRGRLGSAVFHPGGFLTPQDEGFPGYGAKLYRVTCPTMQSKRTCYIHVRGYQIIDGEKSTATGRR